MKRDFYKRKLPHWQPDNSVFAITYNLDGSLPKHIWEQLKADRDFERKKMDDLDLSEVEKRKKMKTIHHLYFGKYDELLDKATNDIQHLKSPIATQIIIESLEYLEKKDFKIICYCIMSNHVHLIIYKVNGDLTKIMQRHKSFTAKMINRALGLTGQFWQQESYDRKIRDRKEFTTQVRYVLFNPVKAGLVKDWQNWEFSWIRPDFLKYVG